MDSFGHDIPAQHGGSLTGVHTLELQHAEAPLAKLAPAQSSPTAGQLFNQLVEGLDALGDEDLGQLSKDIDRLREAIPAEFARRREHYLSLAAKFGVPAAPLTKKGSAKAGGRVPGAAKKATAGGVLPVKYRNPDGPEGWSGRGMTPRWMNKAINESHGRLRKEDFLAGGAAFEHRRASSEELTSEAAE